MNDHELSGQSILPHRDPFLFLDRVVSHDSKGSVGVVTFGAARVFSAGIFRVIRLSLVLFCWRPCASRRQQVS